MRRNPTDGAILLRRLRLNDAETLRSAVRESGVELGRWMRWINPKPTRREATAWIRLTQRYWKERQAFNFGIFNVRDRRLLGGIWLSRIDHKHRYANVGYWVRTDCTRRGIATAAVRLIIGFGFEEIRMNRLEILASVENTASQRVAVKVGARREGILRQRLLLANRFQDALIFSLLREDSRGGRSSNKRL